ncbi:hypothetical protein AGDE_15888 [Angomonas deanei]|nr:hypothetical protein AGDE_15888 [Angomonas deanei]|eukprot:EPY18239.1 hypothetical protein AGDE_15888 [Angomonas deanei]
MVSSVNYCAISILYLKELGLYGKHINEEEVGKMTTKGKEQSENKESKVSLKKANKVLENLMDVAGRTQYDILRLLKQPQYESIKSTQLIIKQSPPLDYFLFPEEDEDTVLYDSRALTSNQLQEAADGAARTGSEGASRHSGSRTKNGSYHSKNVESFFGNVTGAGHISQQTFLYMAKEYTPAIPVIQHFNPASIAVHLRFNIYKKMDEEENALSGVFKESGEPEAAKRKKKGDMVTVEIGNSNSQVGTELQSGNVLSGSQNGNNYNASDNMISGPKRTLLSKKELAKVPTPAERNTLFYTGWFSSRHIRYVPGCSHHLLKNTLSHYYNNYLFYNNKNFVQPQSALMVLGKEETCAFGGLLLSEGALEAYKQQLERKEKRARRKKEQQTGSASPTREPASTTASAASTDTQSSVTTATATVKKNMFTAMVSPNKNLYLNDLKTIQLLELEECFIQGMILMIIHAKVLSDTQCKEKAKKFVKFVRKSAEYFYGSKSPEYKYFEQVISIYV